MTKLSINVGLFFLVALLSQHVSVFAQDVPTDQSDETFTQQQLDYFESKVRPILVRRCNECHANGESEDSLSLASRKAMLAGGDSGTAIVPGNPDESLLIQAIRYDDVYEMPPSSKMPDEEIAILENWVRDGAAWPAHTDVEMERSEEPFDLEARSKEHWCWHPVSPPKLTTGLRGPKAIDMLLSDRIEAAGLNKNGPASRSALLRRISFDLTGLPPNEDLVREYVYKEALSTEELIDRFLASPHFGERWARHWMDLVRYAETHGHEFDYPIKDAWRYRDYLIRALNDDLPYDQFVTEHIAGDLIENPRVHPDLKFNESALATAFWFLGEATHAPVDSKADEAGRIDNQIDVMCRSFIGLTVACARCHDHKFDAISTKDYYALSGFLQSSRRKQMVVDEGQKFAKAAEKVIAIRHKIEKLKLECFAKVKKTGELLAEGLSGVGFEEERDKLANTEFVDALRDGLPRLGNPKADISDEDIEFPVDALNWKTEGFAFAGNSGHSNMIANEEFEWLPESVISSGSNGEPFAGMAHSDTFEIRKKYIHVLMKSKSARVEVVVDGMKMHEFNALLFRGLIHKDVNHDTFRWLTIGGELYLHRGSRAWLEIVDGGTGFFAVERVLFSDNPKPPSNPVNKDLESLKEKLAQEQTNGADAFKHLIMSDGFNEQTLSWLARNDFGKLIEAEKTFSEIKVLQKEIVEISATLPAPARSFVMTEGFPEDEFVFIRGNHKMKGDIAPRQFLTAIVGEDHSLAKANSSGRMQLAKQIVDPSNPLTSRVAVNRVWHHLFGRGIVKSVDNFGVLGEEPSHPELLDHLAGEFVRDGWSVKRLIRKLMLTEAYQRDSKPNDEANEIDPENVLLSRANIRRLQGEAIRDSILLAAGSLDQKMYGPSVPIHLTPFMSGRGRPKSGPIDGNGRRSIYVAIRRNFLSPMMLAFDTPIPFNAIGARSISNVPAQALILMNDPFVSQQAGKFADQITGLSENVDDRISLIYLKALARKPNSHELVKAKRFIETQANRLNVDSDSKDAWKDLCHVIFNTKEFIYLK